MARGGFRPINAWALAHVPRWRASAKIAAAVVAAFTFTTQAKAASSNQTEAMAQQAWSRLLTHCGESYFYAGSIFDHSGMLSSVGAGNNPSVVEFRGVRFHSVPMRVTDAERLNGVASRTRVTMIAHVYRIDGGSWADGPDLQARNTSDIMGLAFQGIAADAGEMGIGGSMAFELIQFKGKWLVSRSSSDLSGPLLSSAGYYSIDQLQGDAAPKFSCPQLSAKVQSTLKDQADAEAKREREKAEEQAWRAPLATHDPDRGIPYLLLSDDDITALKRFYMPGTRRVDDSMLFKAEAILKRYPIVPSDTDWLPVGTTFARFDQLNPINPENGYNKLLMVVTLTSGPHAGEHALIEAQNYGSFDTTRPGRVWRDRKDGVEAERKERADILAADKILVRDPVRGEPFLHVGDDEIAAMAATYQGNHLGTAQTIQLEQAIGARFPETPSDDQWLAPGTTISPILLGGANGSGVSYWTSKPGGKALALVRIETGAHSGEAGLIDLRNYSSNIHTICPPEPEQLACYTPEEAERHRQEDARLAAQHEAEKPLRPGREAPWRFAGDLDAFQTKLVENLNRRAAQFGVDPASFRDEVAKLVELARTCTAITQAEFESAKDQYGIPRLNRIRPGLGSCQTLSARISAPRDDAWIVVDTNISTDTEADGDDDDHPKFVYSRAPRFQLTAYLYPKDRSKIAALYDMDDRLWVAGVIGAEIDFAQN